MGSNAMSSFWFTTENAKKLVTSKKVEDGDVNDVKQTSTTVKRSFWTHCTAIILLCLPAWQLITLRIQLCPRIRPRLAWHVFLRRQERGARAFNDVAVATDGVMTVAVVFAFAVETQVARWQRQQQKQLQRLSWQREAEYIAGVEKPMAFKLKKILFCFWFLCFLRFYGF